MKTRTSIICFLFFLFIIACTKGSEDGTTGTAGTDTTRNSKNVLVMEFVSFDCVYCPEVTRKMNEASQTKYPGRIDIISIHGRLNEPDPMEFKSYKAFQNYFYNVTGYPAVIIDQREDLVTVGSFDATSGGFAERIKEPAKVNIGLSTIVEATNTVKISVRVSNNAAAYDNYRLAVAVLENDIPYKQADFVNGSLQWINEYRHQHVLRAILSEIYFGDPIGQLEKNGSYTKNFIYTIPDNYKKDKLSFAAWVVDATGFADRVSVNSRSVDIGKSVGF